MLAEEAPPAGQGEHMSAYLNRISTALPPNDVHETFLTFASRLLDGSRAQALFNRAAQRCQIEQRWSVLSPAGEGQDDCVDDAAFYRLGAFPPTAERMRVYELHAPDLAVRAAAGLDLRQEAHLITHVVVTSCTGLVAPGLDLQLVERLGLNPSVERTMIGFMGCYAAINALKFARHVVRSEPASRVLILSLELCTLHLHETASLEEVLSFMVFGDGAAAALVSADPIGLSLDRFHAVLAPEAADQIVWSIGDQGFDMVLSGKVPASVGAALRTRRDEVLDGAAVADIAHWAVHPGGRSVLDAVESALDLDPVALSASREVLRRHGNMSSATILFVLKALMAGVGAGERGCAMAFGPGLTAETLLFTGTGR
jgi:predicted naringenin-chalcone synthase